MDECHPEPIFHPPRGSAKPPGGKEVGRAARLVSPHRRLTAHLIRLFQTESRLTRAPWIRSLGDFLSLSLPIPAFSLMGTSPSLRIRFGAIESMSSLPFSLLFVSTERELVLCSGAALLWFP